MGAERMGFLRALAGPVRGLAFTWANPSLVRFMILPWLITLVVNAGLATGAVLGFGWIADHLWPAPPAWAAIPFQVALGLALAVGSLLGGLIVGQILAAPIYTRLAVHTRRLYLRDGTQPAGGLYADVVVPVVVVGGRLLVLVAVQIGLLLLNVVPVVGTVAHLVLGTAATLFWIALDFFDYPLDTEPVAVGLRGRIGYSLRRLGMVMGFAVAMLLVFVLLPVINVFLIPVGVVGATLVYCDDLRARAA